ncbi:MAG TPA: ribonuclease HII [Firmicutes bacterium]|nr:ribonuclease HII [Bacillota bacterium]
MTPDEAREHLERDELERLQHMGELEEELFQGGYVNVAGVDEAGRGPLAGPVVAAAVILPRGIEIPYLNDSKKLSPKRREALYEIIEGSAVAVGVGIVSHDIIDRINILQATFLAMREAIRKLSVRPDYILVDGRDIPGCTLPQKGIVGGDGRCSCIAAASIIAKVTRDRIMIDLDKRYPQYGFARHKGYGTKEHIDALRAYGPCPFHRMSFSLVHKYSNPTIFDLVHDIV